MGQEVVKELNAFLKGIGMAVESYERFIADLGDDQLKMQFQQIQREHKIHAADLSARIQTLGGRPQYDTGFVGMMSGVSQTFERMGNQADVDILKKAYEGEEKGIKMAREIVKGDLDSLSAGLVDKILKEDEEHLVRLKDLMSSKGGGNSNMH